MLQQNRFRMLMFCLMSSNSNTLFPWTPPAVVLLLKLLQTGRTGGVSVTHCLSADSARSLVFPLQAADTGVS